LYIALAGCLEHPQPLLVLGLVDTKPIASRTHSAAAILNTPADALHLKRGCPCSIFSLPKT